MCLNALARFNQRWLEGKVTTPLVLIIGGAAGVGKSTLAAQLLADIPHATVVSTSTLRAAARVFIAEAENPALYQHTFDLGNTRDFLAQAAPISRIVNQMVAFLESEKQHTAIEGSNLVPGSFQAHAGVILVEIYLKVSDAAQHARMLGGPTHNRQLSAAQIENCRMVQEFVVERAHKLRKPVMEYAEAHERALALIEQAIAGGRAGDGNC